MAPLNVYAADPVNTGDHGQCKSPSGDDRPCWQTYTMEEDSGGKVCYMTARPEKSEGDYKKRGDVVALITHRPAEGTRNVFSFMAGYSYKKASDVQVDVDGSKFKLFTQNDMAWAADSSTDVALAEAIQKGSKMTITGISSRGTKTVDVFSLKGSTKAHETISADCQ